MKDIILTTIAAVDDCIAEEIKHLHNDCGIATLACCCGHGRGDGFIAVSDDTFKTYKSIDTIGIGIKHLSSSQLDSVRAMVKMGYELIEPYKYYAIGFDKNGIMRESFRKLPAFRPKSICLCKL